VVECEPSGVPQVTNLVTGNEAHFHQLYGPVLKELPSLTATGHDFSR
jgi:hypothetical protein